MKMKKYPQQNTLDEEILTKFEDSLLVNKMARIISADPGFYKQITLVTEGELYKYKRKLYPKSNDNLGAGFS